MKFEVIKKQKEGRVPVRYFWQVVADNGIVILKSKEYLVRQAALKSANTFKQDCYLRRGHFTVYDLSKTYFRGKNGHR